MHGNNHPQKSREKLVDARLLKKMPIGKAMTGRVMNWDVYTPVHKACGYITTAKDTLQIRGRFRS